MSNFLHLKVSRFSWSFYCIYLVLTMCKASPLPQFVMTVESNSCPYKASVCVWTDLQINKSMEKKVWTQADFDCSLPCAWSQSPWLPSSRCPPGSRSSQPLQNEDRPL